MENSESEDSHALQSPKIGIVESRIERRPKKKRKVSIEPEVADGEPNVEYPEPLEGDTEKNVTLLPPTSLPIFPLPALPNAPSKSELALQGLDKALVDAEIVDATSTIPISKEEDDDLGISTRTRRRLHELGITEMFAGMRSISTSQTLPDFSKSSEKPYPVPATS